ncbi:hypothetical protein [Hymenobacter antarcticus]|uniref:hypothetical protein n=1 Tax=Hymenobacter antarcticus TaxID=486270 RepID=UPI0031ECA61B
MPGYRGLLPSSTSNHPAQWITARLNGLGRVTLIGAGSTTAMHGSEALGWVTSISGSYASRWFFAQAPAPDDEDQEEPEDEEEAQAEPQRRNAPAVRKQSSTEENAEQLREGGTINPPFP